VSVRQKLGHTDTRPCAGESYRFTVDKPLLMARRKALLAGECICAAFNREASYRSWERSVARQTALGKVAIQ
jgi:hypothetical protein